MPSQVDKLQAHAGYLLDDFIGLREKYAMLAPMLFDVRTRQKWGVAGRATGFEILRKVLFLSCCQDMAKLCLDSDKRTPSIKNIVGALADSHLVNDLEKQYAVWVIPREVPDSNPELASAIAAADDRMENRVQSERRVEFRQRIAELLTLWSTLSSSQTLQSFATVRNKVTAHTEVQYDAEAYQIFDIAKLGMKWEDLGSTISTVQQVVELIGLTIRNTGFAWRGLDTQLERASVRFWETTDAAS